MVLSRRGNGRLPQKSSHGSCLLHAPRLLSLNLMCMDEDPLRCTIISNCSAMARVGAWFTP